MIATIKPEELGDPEEGELVFHSHMWVKGSLIHFIVEGGIKKKIILVKVIKQMDLLTTPHPQPYKIREICHGCYRHVSQHCLLSYDIETFKDEVFWDVTPLEFCNVLLVHPYMWNFHVVYESRPYSFIVTPRVHLYGIPKIVLTIVPTK
jgi:hypothetical protein